jgi:hypothetical protein
MSGVLRNTITALMGRLGLGGGGAKSTKGMAIVNFFRLGHRSTRSLEAGAKYGTAVTPSLSLAVGGGDEEDASTGADDEGGGRWEA